MLGFDRGDGLASGEGGLKVSGMIEAPNSIFLAGEFLVIFGGSSVGGIVLTRLMLGLNHDNGLAGGKGGPKVILVAGTPSGVFLVGEFLVISGGSSVGSWALRSSCSASAATSAWRAAKATSR